MATAEKGTWFRLSRSGAGTEKLNGVQSNPTYWVFVGELSGAPKIYTTPVSTFSDISPTYTARTPGGSDPLNAINYATNEDILVAVGDNGTVEESTNKGETWSQQNLSGNPDLHGLACRTTSTTTLFAAAGVNVIWGRTDVGAWTSRWSGSQTWRAIAWRFGTGFVAVGDNGKGIYSINGAAGSFGSIYDITGTVDGLKAIAANDNYYIAVGDDGYCYRSITGVSGGWQRYDIDNSVDLIAVVPLAANNDWVVVSTAGRSWVSGDNGLTWTENLGSGLGTAYGCYSDATHAAICGLASKAWASFDQVQADYVSPVTPPAPPLAFSENADMSDDAARRFATQFKSGEF